MLLLLVNVSPLNVEFVLFVPGDVKPPAVPVVLLAVQVKLVALPVALGTSANLPPLQIAAGLSHVPVTGGRTVIS